MTLRTTRKISFTKKDADNFKRIVAESLVKKYSFDMNAARLVVEKSTFAQMLKEEPRYAYHYDVEYWAEKVKGESKYLLHC
ncbi:MAG: hypothetical protein KGZ56_11015 [Dethiobacter sp.]|nr:hypothetical protein [Dethiobacter sp.]